MAHGPLIIHNVLGFPLRSFAGKSPMSIFFSWKKLNIYGNKNLGRADGPGYDWNWCGGRWISEGFDTWCWACLFRSIDTFPTQKSLCFVFLHKYSHSILIGNILNINQTMKVEAFAWHSQTIPNHIKLHRLNILIISPEYSRFLMVSI